MRGQQPHSRAAPRIRERGAAAPPPHPDPAGGTVLRAAGRPISPACRTHKHTAGEMHSGPARALHTPSPKQPTHPLARTPTHPHTRPPTQPHPRPVCSGSWPQTPERRPGEGGEGRARMTRAAQHVRVCRSVCASCAGARACARDMARDGRGSDRPPSPRPRPPASCTPPGSLPPNPSVMLGSCSCPWLLPSPLSKAPEPLIQLQTLKP